MVFFIAILTTNCAFALDFDQCYEDPFVKHVTLADPARYRLIYTGVLGLIADEYVSFVTKKWSEDLIYYDDGDLSTQNSRISLINDLVSDYKYGKYADKRKHWWHYSVLWNNWSFYATGPTKDIINIGPVRVDNKFGFKLKSYTAALSNRWSLRFRPNIKFTSRPPFIKQLDARILFTYKNRRTKLIRIGIDAGADFKHMCFEFGVGIELLGWGS